MILNSLRRRFAIASSLLLLIFAAAPDFACAKDGPTIATTSFENGLAAVFYFDDSNVVLGHDRIEGIIYRSTDAGKTFKKVEEKSFSGTAFELWPHPFDNQRAYALSEGQTHWMTIDQGETWRTFDSGSSPSAYRPRSLSFHGRDPKKVIFNGEKCVGLRCEEVAFYTEDDFHTVTAIGKGTRGCQWAVGTPQFAENNAKAVEHRIFCVVEGLYSDAQKDQRLLVSDDHFENELIEPALDDGRIVTGIITMASVKGYLMTAAKSEGTDELALYVTVDGAEWHRAEFGQHRIEEDAYTILESTNYSMQVDVLGSRVTNPMGYLFTSNSNGTYFTRNIDHTNRNIWGRVDFEKIQNIQGIVLVNVVDNWQEIERSTVADKKVKSQISFDDGRTFQDLKCDGKTLHLHSVTDLRQAGRVFSSPAPGIVMGIGNTGDSLRTYDDGDLFVSDDAGVTWRRALDGTHLYEFGNQGAVIIAVSDDDATSVISYSIDHGKTWKEADLGMKVRVKFLTTAPDSTTLKFLIGATSGLGEKKAWSMIAIDFEGLHARSCKSSDFERWPARVDKDGKPSCLMGQKQYFTRRKADADCFIEGEFKDPEPESEPCDCTQADFECDYNFIRDADDRTVCKPITPLQVPSGACKNEKDTFKGRSGWRLIPGNKCKRSGGVELDKDIDRPCSDTVKTPSSGIVAVEKTNFNADHFSEWYYLERGDKAQGEDETIVMRTSERDIFITRDHGKTWAPILKGEPIVRIVPHQYYNDAVFFLTGSKTVHYTVDRGDHFQKFQAPQPPNNQDLATMRFHPAHRDLLLWAGAVDDHTNVFYSQDRGDNWNTLARYARKCDFIPKEDDDKSDQRVYCEQFQDENPEKPMMLISKDNFAADSKVHFDDILGFATMSEFIIVAARTEDRKSLKVDASIDGQTFAAAEFPKNFQVAHQQAYTVMDSSTHAVFLHVTVNPNRGREYGAIIKSNSNGTSYVMALGDVNRDTPGYVDFEKMLGLEGVAMVNVVSNVKEVDDGEVKKLKSYITHNDAAEWALLPPPKLDALKKDYACVSTADKATAKCSLHIHSYTERADKSATFSSPSAVGLMMAVGNVGEYMLRKDDPATDTFITRDAGITWKSVKKGSYMWEYGDQGSIIVIVAESKPTRSVFYSLDEGEHWREFEFTTVDMQIDAISTVPSDNSMKFVLWGKETGSSAKRGIFTVHLDFGGIPERQRECHLDETNPVNKDYELWEPKHPLQDSNCLFGHVAQYHRKRLDAECYNGRRFDHLHNISTNCSCTRRDFECDYNYEMQTDGSCQLVKGLEPYDHLEQCKQNPNAIEFWYPTGYRRIPLSTCQGGVELDKIEARPCPGHEEEFNRKHGISGVALFFAIIFPVLAAIGIGYWVYNRWLSQGFGGFGAIRLGDGPGTASAPRARGDPLWITIPVTVISATVAVAKAVPLVVTSLWRSLRGYVPVRGGSSGIGGARSGSIGGNAPYRSRDAFASRRQDYSQVVEDDELLGDGLEDEEEV